MTKRPTATKARSCTGKIRHETRAKALAHLRRLIKRGYVRLSAYECKHCGGHHVGHRPKPRTRR
ncbi:hypothetical protein [Streptomyces sp. UG1]|uniref:hypothetical protein n=1 Tax=Streptomyces sp. UG1 TaxID=3417652 RepID=UPI003CF786B1